jgi:LacI family transcriptional regulator
VPEINKIMRLSSNNTNNITIFDVASDAGVSNGTVSRVLNNDRHVKQETRERVLKSIEELGYTVNRQARSLAGGRTQIIGVLVPDLGTGYIGEIIRGIDAELQLAHYDLMLYTTHRTAVKEANYVVELAQGMVDGLLLVLPRNPTDYVGTLQKRHFPFVLIDHQGTGKDCPAVGATNWQGAYNATEYLIKLGHTRIGFITGSMDLGASADRLEGYQSALRANHIPYLPDLVCESSFQQSEGYTCGLTLLKQNPPPTAIFASNDVMAMGVMDAVRENGKRIPEDISVIGFDDIPQASMVRPALTTIRQPLRNMGAVAAQMLLDMFKDPDTNPKRIELPTELVIRESCQSFSTQLFTGGVQNIQNNLV